MAERCLTAAARAEALNLRSFLAPELRIREQKLVLEARDYLLNESALAFIEFEDPEAILRRLTVPGAVLSETEIYILGLYLRETRLASERFSRKKEQYPLLAAMLLLPESELSAMDRNILSSFTEDGHLKDTASPELSRLRRRIVKLQREVQEKAVKIARDAAGDQISDGSNVAFRNGRIVIPVRASRKNQIPGIIHDQSQSGQTIYIEPMLIVEINNELRRTELAEQDEVYRILSAFCEALRPWQAEITRRTELYHRLDLIHALGRFSVEFRCEIPVHDNQDFLIRNGRNPELQMKREVVPLSLNLEERIRGVVITGPNAGGKTVTLKTIGLMALMNQAGMLLPVDYANLPDFDAIYIDIGDGQSIEGDLSTYSSHINRLKTIVENATSRSLVLLDELGTGTDPDEGAALAEAVLQHLVDRGTLVIATTHHSALKTFAYNHPQLMNGSMSFNDRDLAPSYEFKAGIPGSSYAIEIASRYRMPESILAFARERIGKGREKLEKLISDLQRKIHRYDTDLKDLKTRDADLKERSRQVETLRKDLNAKLKKADREALKNAEEFVRTMHRDFEATIRDVKEAGASSDSIRAGHEKLEALQTKVNARLEKQEPAQDASLDIRRLKPGDAVYVKSMDQNGTIREINLKQNKIWVDISGTRMRLDAAWLAPPVKRKQTVRTSVQGGGSARYHLDLRGFRMEDALAELDKFLDSAVLAGLGHVEVLHGKGDGILKKAIEDLLPQDPRVRSFQPAAPEHGGAGITLISLNI